MRDSAVAMGVVKWATTMANRHGCNDSHLVRKPIGVIGNVACYSQMHNSTIASTKVEDGHVVLAIVSLLTEGRLLTPTVSTPDSNCNRDVNVLSSPVISKVKKKFYEGPHCGQYGKYLESSDSSHICDPNNILCQKFKDAENRILSLCEKEIPMCIEVLVTYNDFDDELCPMIKTPNSNRNSVVFLAERWNISFQNRSVDSNSQCRNMTANQLLTAIRSQMYFSQLSAWLLSCDKENEEFFKDKKLKYRITLPGETYKVFDFTMATETHSFPIVHVDDKTQLNVSFLSIARTKGVANLKNFFTSNLISEYDYAHELTPNLASTSKLNRKLNLNLNAAADGADKVSAVHDTTDTTLPNDNNKNDFSYCILKRKRNRSNIHNSNQSNKSKNGTKNTKKSTAITPSSSNTDNCDKTKCDNNDDNVNSCSESIRDFHLNIDFITKRNPNVRVRQKIQFDQNQLCDNTNSIDTVRSTISTKTNTTTTTATSTNVMSKKIARPTEHNPYTSEVPSVLEQEKFRKSLDSAASMVFHSYIGLPLTSSPAPVRRGNTRFDFDSSLNSVSAIKSALFPLSNNDNNTITNEDDSETDSSSVLSPTSPDSSIVGSLSVKEVLKKPPRFHSSRPSNLLGSFEESVLNGRLEPVSTVHGFKTEICASGSFCPRHLVLPVTVFFYTVNDNDKASSPYMGHINLGKKGYNIPRSGTIQVSLFNPLGTVVKMFVVMYDLSDMPPNCQTFIRQRTFYVPSNFNGDKSQLHFQWLRYLIHLRFMSSKSGRIYLHSDIRMIIFRKSDIDTATDHELNMSYELCSFSYGPNNPKYSPRLS